MDVQDGKQSMMVINPRILFAGKQLENIGILDIAFMPRKKKMCKNIRNIPKWGIFKLFPPFALQNFLAFL